MPTSKTFSGFDTPKQNWFRMPNEWIDICADISSLAELKVVQYVMRHTWGHQEYGILKQISLDEFMSGRRRQDGSRLDKGTGLTKKSVIAGVKSAVERGFLIEHVDDSDRARVKKYYALRMATQNDSDGFPSTPQNPQKTDVEAPGEKVNADVYFLHPDVEKVYPRGKESIHRTEKETLERNNKKEITNNNIGRAEEPSAQAAVVVALSSRKIAQRVAEQLSQQYPTDYIEEKIAFHDFLLAERPSDIKKPAAWLRSAIENDYSAPDGFISAADRERMANEEKSRNKALREAQEARQRADTEAQKAAFEKQEQRLLWLRERFGASKADQTFWAKVQEEIKQSAGTAVYALVADAYVLNRTNGVVKVGTTSSFKLNQLAHPGTQTEINRAASRIAGDTLKLEYTLLEGLPD